MQDSTDITIPFVPPVSTMIDANLDDVYVNTAHSGVLLEIALTERAPSLRLLQGREPRTCTHAIEI
jgi:hypothetical protein